MRKCFRLGGVPWTVRLEDFDSLGYIDDWPASKYDGVTVPKTHTIYVSNNLTGMKKCCILLHEMLHAMLPEASERWVRSRSEFMSKVLGWAGIQ